MLSFSHLGSLGRLGNQLFQIASTIGIAHAYEKLAVFPHWNEPLFPNASLHTHTIDTNHWPRVTMPVHYVDNPLRRFMHVRNLDLHGFMQSEKYFSHCAEYIRELFRTEDHVDPLNKTICSIHVRLTDYVSSGAANVYIALGGSYYMQGIDLMISKGFKRFRVFSDDIKTARSMFGIWGFAKIYPEIEFTFSDSGDDYRADFRFMKQCGAHIIANSTFSWWTAWLSGEPLVVCPRKWFKPGSYSDRDINPERWTAI